MTTDQMIQIISEWIYWLTKPPGPFWNGISPRIPKKYWVDENNNRLYPE